MASLVKNLPLNPAALISGNVFLLDPYTRIWFAILLSAAIHCFILFGVSFKFPAPKPGSLSSPLEVVLVNAKTQSKPRKADALAQSHLDGGGNTDAKRRAKNPLPVLQRDAQTVEISTATSRVEQLEQEAKKLMTRIKGERKVDAKYKPEQKADPTTETNLMQRSIEIARLEAQIAKDWDSYQQRPRRRFIGARTEEYRFARYVEDWRDKVERVGNLNYPEGARQQKIYGSLQVTVSINSNGTVEGVEINRPSGYKILDAAARRIVALAAPFAPFPADILKDTDILYITRTWTFTRSDQLISE